MKEIKKILRAPSVFPLLPNYFLSLLHHFQNPKRGRFCFELRMTAGHKSYLLAAENDADFKDWLSKLSSVLHQNKVQEEKRAASLERGTLSPTPFSLTLSHSFRFQSATPLRRRRRCSPSAPSKASSRA